MKYLAKLAFVVAVSLPAFAHADLSSAKSKLEIGDYAGALSALDNVGGSDASEANIVRAQVAAIRGQYDKAQALLAPLANGTSATGIRARLELAAVLQAVGKYDEARKVLEALQKDRPTDIVVRRKLLLVLLERGDKAAASKVATLIMDDYNNKKLDLDDPEHLFALAEAARFDGEFQLANESYQEVQTLSGKHVDSNLRWADLYSNKYASELAEQTIEEIFKVNPNHPDAHALMAVVNLATHYDMQAVRKHLDQAFAVDPNNIAAILAQASIAIDRNDWKAAKAGIERVLKINPNHTSALAMRATIAWLRDDLKAYEDDRKRALAINPAFSDFYRIVAGSAVREHRYAQAIDLEKQAVALEPKAFDAMSGAGLGYLRMGQEKEGLEWLGKAWEGDKFNVRTFNTRNLFNKTIAKEYVTSTTKSFRIRYHKDEQAVLSRYIEPVLESAFADMVKRYGFTPKIPVTIELFQKRSDYAVRTTGLPDLSALGVCFGQVITAISPSNGGINWGMVLWHELGHVFAIQLSNNRVPRWFTEGLSEYETLRARPDWRRENDADLWGALANKTLPSIGDLNTEFMQPDQSAVVVAYYLSAVTIEYLVQTYGFDKIVSGLKLYGQGKENAEVLQTITGKSIAALDTDFRAYLAIRLKVYKGTFKLPTKGLDNPTKLEIAVDAAPKDATVRGKLALAHYYSGDKDEAVAAAKRALELDKKEVLSRFVLAEAAISDGDAKSAQKMYSELIADGIDNYDIRTKLAVIAKKAGDEKQFEAQLCKAKQLDPERSYPYEELAALYKKRGNEQKALAELETYAGLEQMEIAPLKELMSGHSKLGNWPKVKTFGEMALFIGPSDQEVLLLLGKAYIEAKLGKEALFTFDTALLTQPELRRPALAHIGRARAFVLLGKKAEAKAALALAEKTEPENVEVVALKQQLAK